MLICLLAYRVAFHVEGSLALGQVLDLVLVQVAPAEDAGIHNVGESLAAGNLQSAVQRPWDGDASRVADPVLHHRLDEPVQLLALVAQPFDQRLDRLLREVGVRGLKILSIFNDGGSKCAKNVQKMCLNCVN